ncbi:hypothetical protein [Streptomyces sp. NBC_01477]|uniref:hypothetical protein n=1 Tax=Streptomyces sp. NBC_01477 TaxID=2976015 RepID=UPI002E33061D|nr:hypothetical protein [Streptomyces sp. NBC_01477]
MIPKIRFGTRSTYGLVHYLFGPGKRDEHTDQHLVASWNDFAPDPGRNPQHTIAQLAAQLDQPVKALGGRAREKTFWHCSVRADPGDRHLDDNDWAAIARRIVRAVGIAPEGDTAACRWVAVRHADLKFDKRKAQAEARQIEKDYGLRQLNPGDGTAAKNPTSQERFKAERTGRVETPRETLREAVREARAGAAGEAEFFTRLKDKGLRVKPTLGSSGDLLGYAVALPGDRNAKGEPIWFAGSTLAADLSLPRIRLRLAGATPEQDVSRTDGPRTNWSAPARGRRTASGIAERAVVLLDGDGDGGEGAAQLVGIGEVLDAVAQTSPAATRAELAATARCFERATRSHIRAEQADTRALRSAARGIIRAGGALGRGEDGGATPPPVVEHGLVGPVHAQVERESSVGCEQPVGLVAVGGGRAPQRENRRRKRVSLVERSAAVRPRCVAGGAGDSGGWGARWPVRWRSAAGGVRRGVRERRCGRSGTPRAGSGCAPSRGGGGWTRTPTSRWNTWTCAACRRW